MKISKKLKRQIQYEFRQNNKTNIKFSDIATRVDLNKKTFVDHYNELYTFKFFSIAFLIITVVIIIIGTIFFSRVKKIEIEKNQKLKAFQSAYIATSKELEENIKLVNRQSDMITQMEALNKALEKEMIHIIFENTGIQPDNLSLDQNYQFADELTLEEKIKTIKNDSIIDFNLTYKIYINETEYINIYLNTIKSIQPNSQLNIALYYKAFLENEDSSYEVTFSIHSDDLVFCIENETITNVCNFVIGDNPPYIVKMSIKLNNEEVLTKDIEITTNHESK